ncbi:MAG: DEAD/DEAH box helicase family protein [Prevotella sp.]
MKYLCRPETEGGLGYRETSPNIVSNDLFIPSQLAEFVKNAAPLAWKALMSKHHQDEEELTETLKEFVKARLLNSTNAATFFNQNKRATFEGESIPLFYVSDTELGGDSEFKMNIFSAVEEMPHNIDCDGITLLKVRPDITFFLNGIFIGYLELKSVTNGQTAAKQGRQKIITDYLEAVKGMADRQRWNPEGVKDERKKTLSMFERAIHLVATDINETYVMRGIQDFFDEARRGFYERTESVSTLTPAILKQFKIYPVSSRLLSEHQRFEEVMSNLYAKKMIEKEILYYNFLKYNYVTVNGKKTRTSNRGTLIAPRPKQKFGCDKIMARVKEMLDHEKEPDFYLNKMRREMEDMNVPPEKIEKFVSKRDSFCNNKYVYSLLMQYAAGFGKSNIIGWTALQLKDLRYEGKWAYDKIMIVVDRLQLRDQLDTMMMNMNIDKSMFIEARNQQTFVNALTSNRRIIVVNIQKFMELREALHRAHKKLSKMRVVFLIDEIHRSNTGENNREMINIFDELEDAIDEEVTSDAGHIMKKNLIVGFTATPSEKVLARYGEFKSADVYPFWVPFDSYTMKEAIADGYILDPTKHIIKVALPLNFEVPDDFDFVHDGDSDVSVPKEIIYSNPDRMEKLAQFIVNRLVSLVYGKIHGQGKAMLAVSSIPNAINYCRIIRRLMAEKCQDPKYERYKDAPIAIVYSDNQINESCASMNDGKGEETVIQEFCNGKNGLIIVVDKLQTGFDEPKLHSLFLDKEIRDINAIQTISRVDRKCKYKEECHIVDLTYQNVDEENIREAFKKYCDITVSDFNPETMAHDVETEYDDLTESEPYVRWFEGYKKHRDNVAFTLQMEDAVRQWIREEFERASAHSDDDADGETARQIPNEAKRIRRVYGRYGSNIMFLQDVYEIDAKYYDSVFLKFWEIYCRIYRSLMSEFAGADSTVIPDIDTGDEIPGITIGETDDVLPDEDDEEDEGNNNNNSNDSHSNDTGTSVLEIIQLLNEKEQLTAEEIKKWKDEKLVMFDTFKQNASFMAKLRDDNFSSEDKMHEYMTALSNYRIKLNNRPDIGKVQLLKHLLKDNAEQLLDVFMDSLED